MLPVDTSGLPATAPGDRLRGAKALHLGPAGCHPARPPSRALGAARPPPTEHLPTPGPLVYSRIESSEEPIRGDVEVCPLALARDIVIFGGRGQVGLPIGIALADRGRSGTLCTVNAAAAGLANGRRMPFASRVPPACPWRSSQRHPPLPRTARGGHGSEPAPLFTILRWIAACLRLYVGAPRLRGRPPEPTSGSRPSGG
jgi:hypothetical protein